MVASCASCRKTLDIDPVKCPYCGVLQRNRAADSRAQRLRLALVVAVGLALGGWGGRAAAQRRSLPATLQGVRMPPAPPKPSFEETVRSRVLGVDPYRFTELEDVYLSPEKWVGQSVAMPGLVTDVRLDASGARLRLAAQWATETAVMVDIGSLGKEHQKFLVREMGPRHVFLVKGILRSGPLPGAGPTVHLESAQFESLGECMDHDGPARAAKVIAETLGKR